MANDLKKRMGKLWLTTVAQIEGVRETVKARAGTARTLLEKEIDRMKAERDKLVVRLGEQTLQWVNRSPVPVPSVMQGTVDRLNDLIAKMSPKAALPKSAAKAAPELAKKAAPALKAATAAKKPAAQAVAKTAAKAAANNAARKAAPKTPANAPNKAPVTKKPLDL